VFHLVTHAFFKALLFLSSGVVMHAMLGDLDMRKMSGLKKVLPKTNIRDADRLRAGGVPFTERVLFQG
jgi:NADH-quinone oxidoreductase subunit L